MATERPKRGVPEGLWIRCPQCKATVYKKEVEARLQRLPGVRLPLHLPARDRIAQLLDEDSFEEWFTDLRPCDPLGFMDRIPYAERLEAEQAKTGMPDAAVVGKGFIRGRPVVLGITDFAFMAGSMGSVVGEKLTRAAEEATELQLPLIFVSGSGGGARMQEGILSLMQMAKVSAALARYDQAGGLYICDPDQPDDGRGGRELGPAGRHHPGRAGGDDRLRRASGRSGTPSGWNCRRASRPASSCSSTGSSTAIVHRQRPADRGGPHHRLLRTQ